MVTFSELRFGELDFTPQPSMRWEWPLKKEFN